MKKKNNPPKKIISIALLILLITAIISIIFFKISYQPQSTTKDEIEESNTKTLENITVDNILFSDIEYSFDGNNSLLTYKITNNSTETLNLKDYEIIVKDKDNNVLANIIPSINQELKPNETIETGNAIDINLKDIPKLELILNEE